MDKVALFIAGDERIYFPALVTMLSIKKNNPGKFDYFLCFDKSKLSSDMEKVLADNNIMFVDNRDFKAYEIEKNFTSMSEGKWPIEVFYNYVMPLYLGGLGYRYSVKADYDLLCIDAYDFSAILPEKNTIGGMCSKVSLLKEGLTTDTVEELIKDGRLSSELTDYMNVGFISFNNNLYAEKNYLSSFIQIYRYLAEKNPEAKLLEQIAFSLMLYRLDGDYIIFPDSYNHRVLWTKPVANDLTFDIKNIHYITQYKPWKPIDLAMLRWVVYRGRSVLFSFRNLWLQFAETVSGFEEHCEERRLTEAQLVGLQMFIVRTYNERVARLEKQLQDERKKCLALSSR